MPLHWALKSGENDQGRGGERPVTQARWLTGQPVMGHVTISVKECVSDHGNSQRPRVCHGKAWALAADVIVLINETHALYQT